MTVEDRRQPPRSRDDERKREHDFDRVVLGALAVGFLLRLLWAIGATRAPANSLSDPANYIRIAGELSRGRFPTLGGEPVAFYPVGYPAALAPVAALSRTTGLMSVEFGASLLNVVAGTFTIGAVAEMSRRWVSARAARLAAWMMSLAPTYILYTSVSLSETLCTAMILWVTLHLDSFSHRPSLVRGLLVGGALGCTVLVRSHTLALLVFVPIAAILAGRSARDVARDFGTVAAGAALVLTPWTIANGVQVGLWSPLATNSAAFLCLGHHDGATGGYVDTEESLVRCFKGSPFDNRLLYRAGDDLSARSMDELSLEGIGSMKRSEADWYRSTTSAALSWAVSHPLQTARLSAVKTRTLLFSHPQTLADVESFSETPLLGPTASGLVDTSSLIWHWAMLVAALVGLAASSRCRRATATWLLPVLLLGGVWAGFTLPRYAHPILPFLTVLAAGAVIAAKESVIRRTVTWREATIAAGTADRAPSTVGEPCESE